ncbi:MAG: alanine racemase [Vicinamibacteria bacterium]
MDRRRFLEVGPTAAFGLALAPSVRAVEAEEKELVSSFDPWVEIHHENLKHNVAEIRKRAEGRPILAVIKNNGYGMGVVNAARLLEPESAIHGFAVVKLQEAAALRDAGIQKPILCMGPFDETNLEEAVAREITPMVYTPIGNLLDRLAAKRQKPVPLHICVDTGIGRVGVPHRAAPDLIRGLAGRKSVELRGVMMTFAEDAAFDEEQKNRFLSLTGSLSSEGVRLGKLHAASSFGLFQHPDFFLDMVRPGMAVYGVYSEQEFRGSSALALRPALALKARVAYVKRLEAGDSAGYNRAYRAEKPVWIATLPLGHTDGLPRAVAGKAKVRIGRSLYPIVASISASHTIVEIGSEKTVEIGDEVAVFDWHDGSRPEDLGKSSGASVYDLTMHLNPLLPRKVV